MHPGSIDNPETAAGRVYDHLRAHMGKWFGGWELQQAAETTALSTRISEIRKQLDLDRVRGERIEVKQQGQRWFYRLTSDEGQLSLFHANLKPTAHRTELSQ